MIWSLKLFDYWGGRREYLPCPWRFFEEGAPFYARYEHLPIYKKALDLTIYFENIVRNFSRCHKYTLGTELREKSREIVELIIRANSTQDKLPVLFEIRQRLEGLKVLIRICKEVKAFHRFNSFVKKSEIAWNMNLNNGNMNKSNKSNDNNYV